MGQQQSSNSRQDEIRRMEERQRQREEESRRYEEQQREQRRQAQIRAEEEQRQRRGFKSVAGKTSNNFLLIKVEKLQGKPSHKHELNLDKNIGKVICIWYDNKDEITGFALDNDWVYPPGLKQMQPNVEFVLKNSLHANNDNQTLLVSFPSQRGQSKHDAFKQILKERPKEVKLMTFGANRNHLFLGSQYFIGSIVYGSTDKKEQYQQDQRLVLVTSQPKPVEQQRSPAMNLLALIIAIFAVYLSWSCNTANGETMGMKVLYALFALLFAPFYLIYYLLVRKDQCAAIASA